MVEDSLLRFAESVHAAWGPLSSELVAASRHHIARLLEAPPTEDWLASLLAEAPASRELARDPEHGLRTGAIAADARLS